MSTHKNNDKNKDECSVDQLPSRRIYKAFEQNDGGKKTCPNITSWEGSIGQIVGDNLKSNMYSEVPQDKIANTACLLSTMNTMHTKKSQPSCKEKLCNFFYFWLGDKLEGKLKGGYAKLKEVIQSIYIKLNDGPNNELCANTFLDSTMHNTVNSSILKQRKKVFDYYYDYRTIWTKIKDSQAAGTPCTTAYDTYLTGVKGTDEDRGDRGADGAYGQIKASGSLNQDLYFKKFWDKFEGNGVSGGGTIPEPSKLKSKATGGDDPPPPSPDAEEANLLSCLDQLSSTVSSKPSVVAASSPQVEDGGTTTTPAIISSTLGTLIGLPTLAFMLYKYNLLPPWIRNTFKGRGRNRRRKRSAIRRNFETLTTDTSSLYTTDNSTVAESTFDSSTDNSTIYSDRPLPARKGKNDLPERGRRNNIRYHPT